MSILQKLKNRWKLESIRQVLVVLLVFAATGCTVLLAKKPVLSLVEVSPENQVWVSVIYYILILPVYQVILLIYAFIFGQFKFFWEFEKKAFQRLKGSSKK